MAWTLAALALVLLWDAAGLDLALARLAGGDHGFPWRDQWLTAEVLHRWVRPVAWLLAGWLILGLWWPTGVLRRLPRRARLQWLARLALALVAVNLLKQASHTSCPWDLSAFGGQADYLSHWAWGRTDGGPGRCFPAGHAATGFAFVGGAFVLRPVSERHARWCLVAALAAGLLLGAAQQLRGAHFMSHTLWTGWLCWASAWVVQALFAVRSPTGRSAELAP
jgi:membrane-associated PAP2 superfamily phosphatase